MRATEFIKSEPPLENKGVDPKVQAEVEKFRQWTAKKLGLKHVPAVELSLDTEEARSEHHTGAHKLGDKKVWVYAANRNLVDILRTVFHELVHVRQEELNMVKPGSSYPGSPIEAMADMLAGKYIKIYGKENKQIFEAAPPRKKYDPSTMGVLRDLPQAIKEDKFIRLLVAGLFALTGALGFGVATLIQGEMFLDKVDHAVMKMHREDIKTTPVRNPQFEEDFKRYVELKKLAKETKVVHRWVYNPTSKSQTYSPTVVAKYPDKVVEFAELAKFMVKEYHLELE